MSNNLKVLFYLRKNRLAKDGTVPIMLRFTIHGEMAQLSTGLSLDPELWDAKLNRAMGRSHAADDLNHELDTIRTSVISHYRRLSDHDKSVTVAKLRNAYLGVTPKVNTLLSIYNKFIADIERSIAIAEELCPENPNYITSPPTLQKYKVTRTRLTEFMQRRHRLKDIPLNDITPMFVTDFENFLRVDCQCAINTTGKFMRRFKSIIIIAKNNGWIERDPFANYHIKMENVERGYLTQDELERIMSKKFAIKRLELVRDIFIFACFTGYAYVDVRNLTQDNIRKSFDGNMWLMTKRKKTNVQSNVLLLDIPRKIIEKYGGQGKNGALLPMLSNQRTNSYLKEIADVCGVDKKLTYHLARHTFATTITLSRGVPIETVSKMLGHTNIKTTQVYAKITDNKISEDMSNLTGKLDVFNNSLTL